MNRIAAREIAIIVLASFLGLSVYIMSWTRVGLSVSRAKWGQS